MSVREWIRTKLRRRRTLKDRKEVHQKLDSALIALDEIDSDQLLGEWTDSGIRSLKKGNNEDDNPK